MSVPGLFSRRAKAVLSAIGARGRAARNPACAENVTVVGLKWSHARFSRQQGRRSATGARPGLPARPYGGRRVATPTAPSRGATLSIAPATHFGEVSVTPPCPRQGAPIPPLTAVRPRPARPGRPRPPVRRRRPPSPRPALVHRHRPWSPGISPRPGPL